MLGRWMMIAAVATYLAAVGCVVWSPPSSPRFAEESDGAAEHSSYVPPAAPPSTTTAPLLNASVPGAPRPAERPRLSGLPYRGVAMQVQRVDLIDQYEKSIDEIAEVGADTVSLVVDARQENGSSSRIFIDVRMTPTPEQLQRLIRHAKDRKLRVVLMPIVLLDNPRGNEWRGTIRPDSWTEWWDSYRQMQHHYAWIAQSAGVDLLVVGSELVSTEKYADEWRRTIREVRRTYRGQLTYSANWDHYNRVPFWDDLDLVGMNSYYKLGDNERVPVAEVVQRWRDIQNDLLAFQRKIGKPLILLEAGWCSLRNAASEPWDYTRVSEPLDLELQRKLYQGFFEAWYGNPSLGGFMIWEWPPGEGGLRDKGYTPEGKPAEKVMREWLARPRWEVR